MGQNLKIGQKHDKSFLYFPGESLGRSLAINIYGGKKKEPAPTGAGSFLESLKMRAYFILLLVFFATDGLFLQIFFFQPGK